MVELFKKYGEKYDLDYLLMAAQGYQESTLDHSVRSPVGAIGVMQIMPPTGRELKVGDITKLEPNIHAGVKYMRFMIDEYYKDEPMDNLNKALMALASYNAGPKRLRQLRRETAKRGLDPNLWFGNVERVASERIGRETVTYVSNIYKYYIAYRLITEQREQRAEAKAAGRPSEHAALVGTSRRLFGGRRWSDKTPRGTGAARFGVSSARRPDIRSLHACNRCCHTARTSRSRRVRSGNCPGAW